MIIHLDLDCFFVSAERTRIHQLKNKPVVVCKSGDNRIFSVEDTESLMTESVGGFNGLMHHKKEFRGFDKNEWKKEFVDDKGRVHGIVIAKSYEAKKHGIKTGTHLRDALFMCPNLLVIPSDHLFYQQLSTKLKAFLMTRIPILEQYSIDEFWGDLRGWVKDEDTYSFMSSLQLGKALQKRFQNYAIETLGEVLRSKNLVLGWGTIGKQLIARLSGEDNEAVIHQKDRKSIGISRNFHVIHDRNEVMRRAIILSRHLSHTIAKLQLYPTTYYFKIRYENGVKSQVSHTIDRAFSESMYRELTIKTIQELDEYPHYGIHHLSLQVSNFVTPTQTKTFSLLYQEEDEKAKRLNEKLTKLRDKYGVDIVRCGVEKKQSKRNF